VYHSRTAPGLRVSASAPPSSGGQWPPGVPLQIHTREADSWGDADVARQLAATIEGAELFLYPGEAHLFTDRSLPDYDAGAAALLEQRVLGFLARLDGPR
jgi:dienelactone hydrolase